MLSTGNPMPWVPAERTARPMIRSLEDRSSASVLHIFIFSVRPALATGLSCHESTECSNVASSGTLSLD